MAGSNPDESVLIDMCYEGVRDFCLGPMRHPFVDDKPEQEKLMHELVAKYCPKFEAIAAKSPESAFILDKVSYADVCLVEVLFGYAEVFGTWDWLAAYPALTKMVDAVKSLPGIDAYLKSPKRFKPGDAACKWVLKCTAHVPLLCRLSSSAWWW